MAYETGENGKDEEALFSLKRLDRSTFTSAQLLPAGR